MSQTEHGRWLRDEADGVTTGAIWEGIEAELHRRPQRPRVGRIAPVLGLAAAAAAVMLWVSWSGTPSVPDGSEAPGPLALADGAQLAGALSTDDGTVFRYDDGSELALSAGAEVAVERNAASQIAFALRAGQARFDIVPGGPREWTVVADDVEITVLGTVFSVDRRDDRVHVTVERGHVRVRGPRVPGGEISLRAGQEVHVGPPEAPTPPEAAVENEPATPPASAPSPPRRVRPRRATPAPVDRLAEADAARAAGRWSEAARAYEQLAAEANGDGGLHWLAAARLHAFRLSSPERARRAYDRALASALPEGLRAAAISERAALSTGPR